MQEMLHKELQTVWTKLLDEEKQRRCLEEELVKLKKLVSENSDVYNDVSNCRPMVLERWLLLSHFMSAFCVSVVHFIVWQAKRSYIKDSCEEVASALVRPMSFIKSSQSKEAISGRRATIAKIFEEGKYISISCIWIIYFQQISYYIL